MKILSVVGARPQFIKCAPLSKEIRKKHDEVIVHTGQHYDYEMSKIFFNELAIPEPDYNLNVGSDSHGHQTGKIIALVEDVLVNEKPDVVVVFGDTNSTLSGALAASKLNIPIAHVESGLRSFDRTMPEEINRVLTDHISTFLFAPTTVAVSNLHNEGIVKGVYKTGDVMVDSLAYAKGIALTRSNVLSRLDVRKREYYVMTIHRASNTDDPEKIRRTFRILAKVPEPFVFPLHPRTKKLLEKSGLMEKLPNNIIPIEPLGYLDMIALIANARGVLTDSGGIQKESFILGTRCITLRRNTEWVETLVEQRNCLVDLDAAKLMEALEMPALNKAPRFRPFGTVGASERIANILNLQTNKGI